MTAPDPIDPQAAADLLAERLLAVTASASVQATVELQAAIRALTASLIVQWVIDFGSVDAGPANTGEAAPFIDYAREQVAALHLDPAAQTALEDAVDLAHVYGVQHAERFIPKEALSEPTRAQRALPSLEGVLDDQRAQALLALDERLVADRGFGGVVQSMAKVQRAVTRIEANTAFEVTRAANDGVRDRTPAGWLVVWVAERDACLHCLALAGHTAAPGQAFPSSLTFADKPMPDHEPLVGPPKHPHCRCALQPLHPDDTAVATGLQREARRSVLRGMADEDSEAAKLRAADRLLNAGARLPKSVEARARKAVSDGRFN